MKKLLIVAGAGSALAALFAACKLDLDESLIDQGDASSDGGGSGGAGGLAESGIGGSGGTGGKGDGGPCDADTQCKSDAACLEGTCSGGQCLFELCPSTTACTGRSCDTSAGVCSQPQTYGFKATSIELPTDIGCGGAATRCVAAFGDLVFVATSDGTLHAWRTSNPAAPEKLTVDAPTFTVARMVAAEGRLLILSAVANDKLQLAWLDPPADPKATSLTLTSVGVNFAGTINTVYPAGPSSFLIVENNAQSFYPAALLAPPIQNNATVSAYPSTGLAPGAAVVAAAGSRLVSFRMNTTPSPAVPTFTLVQNAGTTNAQNGNEQAVSVEAPTDGTAHYFASGFDGSVLWSTNRVYQGDAGTMQTSAVVLRWALAAGSSTFDATLEVDLASYSEADSSVVRRGPIALIDANTVLATAAYPVDPQQTLVRSVTRSGSSLALGSATAVLPFSTGQIGVTANRKVGVVLTPTSTTPALKATLHLFAPGCG